MSEILANDGSSRAAANAVQALKIFKFVDPLGENWWCYLCKLEILSSSYGSYRAATNAFQELKTVPTCMKLEYVVKHIEFEKDTSKNQKKNHFDFLTYLGPQK